MNCNTGHLIRHEMMDAMDEHKKTEYTRVPPNLSRAAHAKLWALQEATVSLTSGGKLATWANNMTRNQRKAASRKARGK